MKSLSYLKTSLLAATMLIIGCQSTDAPPMSSEGMKLEHNTRSTTAYIKEGVNFSNYNKLQFSPSTVAFKLNWQRDYNRENRSSQLKDKDVIRIKESVKKLFDEVFQAEFSNSDRFSIVKQATTATLLLKPAIIDLNVYAPDVKSASFTKTYVNESGKATLFLEIYDAVSGEILARIIDSRTMGENSFNQWELASRVSNTVDAKRVVKKWANTLRKKFEQAHDK